MFGNMMGGNEPEYTPEQQARVDAGIARRAEENRVANIPFAKAKEMGFEVKETPEKENGLYYKGEQVFAGFMKSWYAEDDDYLGYKNFRVYATDTKVGVKASHYEIGADRPGYSDKGYRAYCLGTLDGEKFVPNKGEERDCEMEK